MTPPAPAADQNRPIVMRADRLAALARWLVANWVYTVSAASLGLAGIFLVQYGVENGYLTPPMRVLGALAFGGLLVASGEWIRRRFGDSEGPTAYLPSTFSAAGIVSMFGGIVAARLMYGLIGVEAAMAGLVAVAGLAILLGWFHGPLLAAMGLMGATMAPFLTGGSATDVDWLFGYFALVALVGLAVDAFRRWAWISVLALALAYGAGALLHVQTGGVSWFAPMLVALVAMTLAVPDLRLWPAQEGPTVTGFLRRRTRGMWPSFPVRLAAGTMVVSTLALVRLTAATPAEAMLILACLVALGLAASLWAARAPALADLAAVPVAGFLARLVIEALDWGGLATDFANQAIALRPPETAPPLTVTLILIGAAMLSAAAGWRSLTGRDHSRYWAAGAALVAPLAMLVLETLWTPAPVLGAYPWALHAMALAGLMVALALAFARADGAVGPRSAYATLSALTLIVFAMFAILTKGALTLALAALILVAAVLDRRFRMAEMTWFLLAGILVLGWRLIVDPGMSWAISAPLGEVLLAHVGVLAALAAGLWLLADMPRRMARLFLEGGFLAFAGLLAEVLIQRWIAQTWLGGWPDGPWPASVLALPSLIVALTHLYRLRATEVLRWLRWGLAGLAGLGAAALLGEAVFDKLPLIHSAAVAGPWVADTLALAYAVPGLILLVAPRWLSHLPRGLVLALRVAGVALVTLYAGLEIRRFFQGDVLSNPGTTQGELYAYTMAMLLVGATLLYEAIARRSVVLRRVAMGVIALTIAKVFLIDISGLTGLTRVASFLGLGLALAGLAWLNRWAADRQGTPPRDG